MTDTTKDGENTRRETSEDTAQSAWNDLLALSYEGLEISIDFLKTRWDMDSVPLCKVVEIRDKIKLYIGC